MSCQDDILTTLLSTHPDPNETSGDMSNISMEVFLLICTSMAQHQISCSTTMGAAAPLSAPARRGEASPASPAAPAAPRRGGSSPPVPPGGGGGGGGGGSGAGGGGGAPALRGFARPKPGRALSEAAALSPGPKPGRALSAAAALSPGDASVEGFLEEESDEDSLGADGELLASWADGPRPVSLPPPRPKTPFPPLDEEDAEVEALALDESGKSPSSFGWLSLSGRKKELSSPPRRKKELSSPPRISSGGFRKRFGSFTGFSSKISSLTTKDDKKKKESERRLPTIQQSPAKVRRYFDSQALESLSPEGDGGGGGEDPPAAAVERLPGLFEALVHSSAAYAPSEDARELLAREGCGGGGEGDGRRQHHHTIALDVRRTPRVEEVGAAQLRALLSGVCMFLPDVGYVQGMNYIGHFFLRHLRRPAKEGAATTAAAAAEEEEEEEEEDEEGPRKEEEEGPVEDEEEALGRRPPNPPEEGDGPRGGGAWEEGGGGGGAAATRNEVTPGELEDSFWALSALLSPTDMTGLYREGMPGLHLRFFQLERLQQWHLPELADRLRSLQIPANLYATGWFVTLLTDASLFPEPEVTKLWDAFFIRWAAGGPRARWALHFRALLGALRALWPRLARLPAGDFDAALALLHRVPFRDICKDSRGVLGLAADASELYERETKMEDQLALLELEWVRQQDDA